MSYKKKVFFIIVATMIISTGLGLSIAYFTSMDRSDDNYIHIGEIKKKEPNPITMNVLHMIGATKERVEYKMWYDFIAKGISRTISDNSLKPSTDDILTDTSAKKHTEGKNVRFVREININNISGSLDKRAYSTDEFTTHCLVTLDNKNNRKVKLSVNSNLRCVMKENYHNNTLDRDYNVITSEKLGTIIYNSTFVKAYDYSSGEYKPTKNPYACDLLVCDFYVDIKNPQLSTVLDFISSELITSKENSVYLNNSSFDVKFTYDYKGQKITESHIMNVIRSYR